MKTFWKYHTVDYFFVALELKKRIPELKNTDAEWVVDHLRGSNLLFFKQEKTPVPFYVRLTLIPAIIVMTVLTIFLPVNYIITGQWGYNWLWLKNWFTSLGF